MKLIWKMLAPELKVYRGRLIIVMIFGITISGLKSLTPQLLQSMGNAWDAKDERQAVLIPIYIGAIWLAAAILRYFHLFWMLYTSDLIAVNLRRKLMNKYLTLNLSFFHNFVRGTGGLISRMLTDITIIQGGFQKIADIVREPFMVLFSLFNLFLIDWKLTLFLLGGAPIVSFILRSFARSIRKYAKHNLEEMEDLTQILKESLDGTRVVQSFNLQEEMRGRFNGKANEFMESRRKIISREEASGPVSESLLSVFMVLILIYLGRQALGGNFTNADLMAFVFAAGLLADSTKKVQAAYTKLQSSAVALERLHSILDEKSVVPEIGSPKPFPEHWKDIEFRNVTFRYENNVVIKNLNLKIQRGESVALVGSSGAGKSTLINLLPRFFDPSEGEVFIGDVPIDEMKLDELRSKIGLVTQDVFLFSDSVERNIWSGNFGKTPADIETAAKLANAHEFILRAEEGYKARVGERGSRFSGGEKQRISIARAIFKNAPILILDEATSALDSESELEVQKGLDSLMRGKTALVIAHRLSTISKCDRILVMDKGEIVEQGSHNELMVRQGAYYRFFQLQSRL